MNPLYLSLVTCCRGGSFYYSRKVSKYLLALKKLFLSPSTDFLEGAGSDFPVRILSSCKLKKNIARQIDWCFLILRHLHMCSGMPVPSEKRGRVSCSNQNLFFAICSIQPANVTVDTLMNFVNVASYI